MQVPLQKLSRSSISFAEAVSLEFRCCGVKQQGHIAAPVVFTHNAFFANSLSGFTCSLILTLKTYALPGIVTCRNGAGKLLEAIMFYLMVWSISNHFKAAVLFVRHLQTFGDLFEV